MKPYVDELKEGTAAKIIVFLGKAAFVFVLGVLAACLTGVLPGTSLEQYAVFAAAAVLLFFTLQIKSTYAIKDDCIELTGFFVPRKISFDEITNVSFMKRSALTPFDFWFDDYATTRLGDALLVEKIASLSGRNVVLTPSNPKRFYTEFLKRFKKFTSEEKKRLATRLKSREA